MGNVVKLPEYDHCLERDWKFGQEIQRKLDYYFGSYRFSFVGLYFKFPFKVIVDSLNEFIVEFENTPEMPLSREETFVKIFERNYLNYKEDYQRWLDGDDEVSRLQKTTGRVLSRAIQPRDGSISLNSDENPPKARKRLRKQPIEK